MSAATQRHVPLTGTHNVRDVGGYPTADGRSIRWNTLIRADALHRLTDAGRAHFAEMGLRTVLDLRERAEREHAPDAFTGPDPVQRWVPIFAERLDSAAMGLPEIYRRMVDDFGDRLVLAVRELARPGALPAVVHCSAGKDRTGVVIALALSVAGVAPEVIAEDYAMTGEFLGAEYLADIEQRMAAIGLSQQPRDNAVACPPELIHDTLTRITGKHGTVRDFLLAHGATGEELEALRTALVS
ncbi:tyrosine-protein phosphatase [Saccharopolyspora sp. WRP15-2]|uniref:Tyrosine-protein phosphatase n=1 Tax=Saccharopolyspora oryzae TaxID=2997343 RepID=A0ABT4URS8_9PSEU|nr:tyrosine-protein phosphatase [Saccharopolyspora oryzae]MDA3624427.1 tyrosine-protein phosphatase [Saccharopolyspora oryzae]